VFYNAVAGATPTVVWTVSGGVVTYIPQAIVLERLA